MVTRSQAVSIKKMRLWSLLCCRKRGSDRSALPVTEPPQRKRSKPRWRTGEEAEQWVARLERDLVDPCESIIDK